MIFVSGFIYGQQTIALKIRLLQAEEGAQLHYQINQGDLVFIWQNVHKNIEVQLEDRLTVYVDDQLVETIEISQNIIDRKRLSLVVTASEVLDELEIEYTDLNAVLGFEAVKTTRTERAVMKDNQLFKPESVKAHVVLDGLFNKLRGRAKENKKAMTLEQEYDRMMRFLTVYSDDYLFDNYNLPRDKAPFFALKMTSFLDENTKLESTAFMELMEQQLLEFLDESSDLN